MIGTREFAEELGWKTSTGRPHTHAVCLVSRAFELDKRGDLTRVNDKWHLTRRGVETWRAEILPEFERRFAGQKEIRFEGHAHSENGANLFVDWGWEALPVFGGGSPCR